MPDDSKRRPDDSSQPTVGEVGDELQEETPEPDEDGGQKRSASGGDSSAD